MGERSAANGEIRIERREAVVGEAPLLLTIPQAALALAVGRTTVYELIGAGAIETVHIGRSVRVPVEALRAFVDQKRAAL